MFETFEHRADIGVRGKSKSIEGAFEECAKALTSIMANPEKIEPLKSHVINLSADDKGALLVAFLNELLFLKDTKKMLYAKFRLTIGEKLGAVELKAVCFGEKINPEKHELTTDAKAATYTELLVKKQGEDWIAQCIIDV